MNASPLASDTRPVLVLQDMIARHGRVSVLFYAVAAVLRPSQEAAVLTDKDLSAHLRRDIGLTAQDPPPRTWQHYR